MLTDRKGQKTRYLSIPGPRLYRWDANDMIVCEAHTSPSDWAFIKLSQAESDEWRGFMRAEFPGVDPCEMCA